MLLISSTFHSCLQRTWLDCLSFHTALWSLVHSCLKHHFFLGFSRGESSHWCSEFIIHAKAFNDVKAFTVLKNKIHNFIFYHNKEKRLFTIFKQFSYFLLRVTWIRLFKKDGAKNLFPNYVYVVGILTIWIAINYSYLHILSKLMTKTISCYSVFTQMQGL